MNVKLQPMVSAVSMKANVVKATFSNLLVLLLQES